MIEAMLEHAEYGDMHSGIKKRKLIEEARKALGACRSLTNVVKNETAKTNENVQSAKAWQV